MQRIVGADWELKRWLKWYVERQLRTSRGRLECVGVEAGGRGLVEGGG